MDFFKKYFLNVVIHHYVDFKGRATRKEYWLYILLIICLSMLIGIILSIGSVIMIAKAVSGNNAEATANMIATYTLLLYLPSSLLSLLLFLPSLAIAVRRFHDTGRSGWWILIGWIPIIGIFWFLYIVCQPSQQGANQFGDEPSTNQIEIKT